MSITGEHTQAWADGVYTFRLAMTHILELEAKCKAGIAVIHARVKSGAYSYNDVRETIRLALIGGGLKPEHALTLTLRYVDERPVGFADSHLLAQLILGGVFVGFEISPLGDEAVDKTLDPVTAPSPSTPPPSMSSADALASVLQTLNASRFGNGAHG